MSAHSDEIPVRESRCLLNGIVSFTLFQFKIIDMKRIVNIGAILCVVSLLLAGCDKEPLNNRKVYTLNEELSSILASGGVDVIVDETLDFNKILVRTNAKDIERVTIDVQNGVLDIYVDETLLLHKDFVVSVPAFAYEYIEISEGCDFMWNGCSSDYLSLKVSSGSDCEVKGSCITLDLQVSEGSDADCGDLYAEDVTVSVTDGSDASIWASRTLSLTAKDGSDINVTGNPEILLWDVSDGSDVDFE